MEARPRSLNGQWLDYEITSSPLGGVLQVTGEASVLLSPSVIM